jgi:methyl-accepting chemotaxis protein
MSPSSSLKGLSWWMMAPGFVVGPAATALMVLHAWLNGVLTPDTLPLYLGLSLLAALLYAPLGTLQQRQSLRVLLALERGQVAESPEALRQALREVRAAPGRGFWLTLQGWLGSMLLVLATFLPLSRAPWTVGWRLATLALAIGPLCAMLIYVLTVRRSRRVLERLAARGLSPLEVIETLPPQRLRMRWRLVTFIAVAVLSPSVLILDVAVVRTVQGLEDILHKESKAEQRQVVQQAHGARALGLAFTVGLVMAMGVAVAAVGGSVLASPLSALTAQATRMARGELRTPQVIHAEDEVWVVCSAFLRMQVQLTQALLQLQRAGLQISTATDQLITTSHEQESGADEQSASLNETRATTEELARSAQQVAVSAESVSAMAESTFAAAQSGQRSAAAFLASMHRMKADNQDIADAVVRLNKRVQQIGKVVEFINEIADKSDLLALNAELEGTKAGEVGRGFSLVAAEMRRLAENVLKSTLAIERLIDEIRDATQAAVMATEAGLKTTESGAALAARVDQSLSLILELARQTSQAVRAISLATQQQQEGTDQLAAAMGDILRVTEQNAESTREVAHANTDLSTLARELKAVVERFHIEDKQEGT